MAVPGVGISIVITVKNEAAGLVELFSGLAVQEGPFEVVLVDSQSTDHTADVVKQFQERLFIKHIIKKSTRGEGRNIGVQNASHGQVIFMDGDVTVSPGLVLSYRKLFREGYELIAGEVVSTGVEKFRLGRVELIYRDFEITRPSANLGYRKEFFLKIGGFDPAFITAEDIDLNLRAIKSGAKHTICRECIIYNKTRNNYGEFTRQAFWNGYGRRQLKRKNRDIWNSIEKGPKVSSGPLFQHLVRLAFGGLGYLYAYFH
ncbi:MAG: glycosyltransferase [Candidatus Thermoplasmatota archaeon]|nr:glycosyltransferase [Candidatus Thermoplasmatota archaeon]